MPDPTPRADWHAKTYGGYGRSSTEAFENAICVYNLLSSIGWTCQAISAVYGNIEAESGYNPWRWEGDNVPSTSGSKSHGYGFCQFTPATKYINNAFARSCTGYGPNYSNLTGNIFDGDAQLRYIDAEGDYEINPAYNFPITYTEFKTDPNLTPEYLAKAWLHNYERPGDQSTAVEDYRAAVARFWYDILIQYDPSPPIPPPQPTSASDYQRKFQLMFYLKPWYKRL